MPAATPKRDAVRVCRLESVYGPCRFVRRSGYGFHGSGRIGTRRPWELCLPACCASPILGRWGISEIRAPPCFSAYQVPGELVAVWFSCACRCLIASQSRGFGILRGWDRSCLLRGFWCAGDLRTFSEGSLLHAAVEFPVGQFPPRGVATPI